MKAVKKTLAITSLALALPLAAVSAAQAAEVSANVALTTDYKFRGISQSNEEAAIQGGFDFSFENGVYVGTWGSVVDFDVSSADGGLNGSLELDYYIGYAGDISEDVSFDVGYLYYDYPGDDGLEGDYQELYGSLSFADLTVGLAYSDDYYAETEKFFYYYVDYELSLGSDISLSFHAGYNDLDEDGGFLATDEDSYVDYSISLGKAVAGVDLSLAYVGTNLDEEDVFDTDWGEDTVVFSISKSM